MTTRAPGDHRPDREPSPRRRDHRAGATLIAMQRRGHRVVNLACSLGRPDDRVRRHNELLGATQIAGFDNVILDPPATIGGDEDLDAGVAAVRTAVAALIDELRADVVVSPHPHDGHHGHEAVARGVLAAVKAAPRLSGGCGACGATSRCRPSTSPTKSVMGVVTRAIAEHRGENERNGYDRMVHGRAATYRCLGSERVFGFGPPPPPPTLTPTSSPRPGTTPVPTCGNSAHRELSMPCNPSTIHGVPRTWPGLSRDHPSTTADVAAETASPGSQTIPNAKVAHAVLTLALSRPGTRAGSGR